MSRVLKVDLENPEKSVLGEAARVVVAGGVIVYPTETLYGIGADAMNPSAIRRVIAAKTRQEKKPILAIVHTVEMVERLVAEIPDVAKILMDEFWPGPLTIVFKAAKHIPAELVQENDTIGIRISSSRFCLELLKYCNCPLTSTSANKSGEPVHRSVDQIAEALNTGIDLYIDGGVLPESKPSTVVSIVDQKPKLIREGAISFERIHLVVPSIQR